jgi:four helix bundle protein
MEKGILNIKSLGFAIRIVRLFQHIQTVKKEYVLSKQVLRSGTSVGTMVREAEHAESKADFVHKLASHRKKSTKPSIGLNC